MPSAQLVVIESADQAAGPCTVCGNEVAAGAGITAEYDGRILRFRCPGCFSRFQAAPERFLAGTVSRCCAGAHDQSAASEWVF